MTFETVSRVPPEGGEAQEMLAISGASVRLTPESVPDDGAMIFSVWAQASAAGQISVSIGDADQAVNVSTEWTRLSVSTEAPGNVVITAGGGITVYLYKAQMEAGNRVTDWRPAPEDTDDEIEDARRAAGMLHNDFHRVIRIDDSGLHVGDNLSGGEVLIDSESMNVVLNGIRFSKFASNYVQFGNYQLRRSADGGLAFKLKEG